MPAEYVFEISKLRLSFCFQEKNNIAVVMFKIISACYTLYFLLIENPANGAYL
jgi:hypothetical protein